MLKILEAKTNIPWVREKQKKKVSLSLSLLWDFSLDPLTPLKCHPNRCWIHRHRSDWVKGRFFLLSPKHFFYLSLSSDHGNFMIIDSPVMFLSYIRVLKFRHLGFCLLTLLFYLVISFISLCFILLRKCLHRYIHTVLSVC